MNENELTQIEIDILDKMCLDNEEDKEFKEWYKKDNNKMKDQIKNESLTFEKYIMEEEIKKGIIADKLGVELLIVKYSK